MENFIEGFANTRAKILMRPEKTVVQDPRFLLRIISEWMRNKGLLPSNAKQQWTAVRK